MKHCVCPSLFTSPPILTFSAFAISLSHSRDLFQLQRGENLFPDECDPCLWRHVLPLSCRLKKPLDFSILPSFLLLHSFTFHLSHSIYLLPTLSRKKLHSLPRFLFFFLKRNFKKQRLRPINISYNFSFSFSLQLHPKTEIWHRKEAIRSLSFYIAWKDFLRPSSKEEASTKQTLSLLSIIITRRHIGNVS